MNETVAFVGLGLMGRAMAGRLLDRELPVTVWNRTAEKAQPLAARGARVAASPREAAREADRICLMLLDGPAVDAVLEGPDGLEAALGPGKTVVNLSTVGPRAAREFDERVRRTGAGYVDAPVLGSVGPAASGELLIFAAAEPEAIERARPLLEALSKRMWVLRPAGRASALKLVCNMLLARYAEALGEVMALSRALELDARTVLEVLQASALASPMWDKGRTLLAGPAPLHFPLRHMLKDLNLLDEEIDRAGLSLPAHEAVLGLYAEAAQGDLAGRDYSEIARIFESAASEGRAGAGEGR